MAVSSLTQSPVDWTGLAEGASPEAPPSPFAPLHKAAADRPFAVAQLGQSLDGRIATVSGESRYINGPAALDHLHRLRAHVDAVVVGVGTVLADDPQLTVRRGPAGPSPARVVIDPSGRLPPRGKWLAQDGVRRLLISTQKPASEMADVEWLPLPLVEGHMCPHAILAALFAQGLKRVLIEGGATTIGRFLDAGALDRLHLLVSPVLIGSGRTGLDLAPVAELSRAQRPLTHVHHLGGGDVLFDCDLSSCRHGAP